MSFTLTKSSTTTDPYYFWETNAEHIYRGCDIRILFPYGINLYLKSCTDEELSRLLAGEHFLRLWYEDSGEKCSIKAMLLEISGCIDPKYSHLVKSLHEIAIPVEIKFGPYLHLLTIEKLWCQNRNITFIFGTQLLGRDRYDGESEQDLKRVIEKDEIFIFGY